MVVFFTMPDTEMKKALDALYERFNAPEHIHPDPLEFVLHYPNPRDREIVGLISSCLAYGRVQTILKSVASLLDPLEGHPHSFILSHSLGDFKRIYRGFVHRFTKGKEVACLFEAIRKTVSEHGSLKNCFLTHYNPKDPTIVPALQGFIAELRHAAGSPPHSLLPDPARGSAMKRCHLFLRWMVRHDRIDPGGWDMISPSRLLYPLDTHIHAFGLRMGLTRRKSADLKTAIEITEGFRGFAPDDPVRYDFALTRIGILKLDSLRDKCFKDIVA